MTISMNLFMAHLLNALFMGELGNNHIQVDFLPQTESLCRHPYFWRYLADLHSYSLYSRGRYFFKDLLRYPLAKEGVYAPGGTVFLAHTKQRVNTIVDLTVLRLAFFTGYG